MRRHATVHRPVITAGYTLVFLLFVGRIPCSFSASDTEYLLLPRVLIENLSNIQDFFCKSDKCVLETGCQLWEICRQDSHYSDCDKPDGSSNGDCDSDQQLYCMYYGARVCVYDGPDLSSSCMYYYTGFDTLKYCVCDGSQVPRGSSCTDSTTSQSTRKPTTSTPVEATTSTPAESNTPSPQVNVEAIIIGSVLSVVLLLILLVIFWLCWTKKLTLQRRSRNADAPDEASGKDRPLELLSGELRKNADQQPGATGLLNPTYTMKLNEDHYYCKIRDEGEGQVRPLAPLTDTEAPVDHQYFVLERDGEQVETDDQAISPEEPKNHDYFVLEKNDSEHGDDYATEGAASRATTSRPVDESYDHTRRPGPGHPQGAPLSKGTGYDHIKRPSRDLPQEGVPANADDSYAKLEPM